MHSKSSEKTERRPIEERIRERAYELYVRGGRRPDSELADWLHAEKQIRAQRERQDREQQERAIDEASEESFPASDPPAY